MNRTRSWALAGGLALALAAGTARAAIPIDDAHPEAAVAAVQRSGNPIALAELLQELGGRAETAAKRGDHAAAARHWRALTEAVPGRAYAFARLCDALEAAGRFDEALVACRTAIIREGTTAGDYTHFVKLLLAQAKDGPLTPAARRQVDLVLGQLAKEPAAALIAERVRCNVAVHDHDFATLEDCTGKLVAAAPDDPRTIVFQWTLALGRRDLGEAERLQAKAKAAGIVLDAGAPAKGPTVTPPSARAVRAVRWGLAGLGAVLVLSAVGGLAARVVAGRRRRLAS